MAPDLTTEPAADMSMEAPAARKKRPRLDLTADSRERKRGKSMFGILVGTLNKAKKEDQDRNTSEAAKKRADIDRRLQAQLAEETDSVRRAEELKRDRQAASRKEEELKLRESIYHRRRTRLPALAHFLLTSDTIPAEDSVDTKLSVNPLAAPPRLHPPPLYYLPAVLLPNQAAFLQRRKAEVKEATEKEWQDWLSQKKEGYDDLDRLRAQVEEEEKRRDEKKYKDTLTGQDGGDHPAPSKDVDDVKMEESHEEPAANGTENSELERAKVLPPTDKEKEKDLGKEGDVVIATDGDDAVEY
ncbi:hypothetical protein BU17DRAFT_41530 [Hysterangium stoloniferum]|nr:hypothetical protein BU17DRAFT_41530 [Hysterangium stoloniferum]